MNAITQAQHTVAYQYGIKVYSGQITLTEAKKHLVAVGLNPNTAVDLINDYRKLRDGKVYKRALSAKTTDDYLDWILRDLGVDAHNTGVKALEQHVRYYQNYSGSPMQSHVLILKKHQAIAVSNASDALSHQLAQGTLPTATSPVHWIFQFNPDHNLEDFEDDLKTGTVMTWQVKQHASQMELGQRVYLWRAAGKKKQVSGIIAVSSIRAKPATRQHFTQPVGKKRIFDSGEPDFCAALIIEQVFRENDKMLRKDTILTDPVLKHLEIATVPRQTNYPIEPDQSRRITELLGLQIKPAKPQYKDFGEAPNDNPDELQTFAAKVRKGQPKFRKKLLDLYGSKCAITGTPIVDVLEACHLWLHSESGINHSENGILLRSDIHVLFDQGMIDIEPETMTVLVSPQVKASEYGRYHGLVLPVRSDGSQLSQIYLKKRKGSKNA